MTKVENKSKQKKGTFLSRNMTTVNLIVNISIPFLTLIMVLITFDANKKSLKLTEKSINAQITALNESQKQFEKQNKPFLQIRDFKLIDFNKDKNLEIFYWLQNLGNYPARVTERTYGYFIDSNTLPQNPYSKVEKLTPTIFDEYITKESALSQKFTSRNNINEFYYNKIINKEMSLYFYGDVIYINELNNKKSKYQFYVKIFPPPSIEYKIIYMKNTDIE